MSRSTIRRNGSSWLLIVLAIGLLVAENLPGEATAALATVAADDLASLPVMYE
ncbi:hypothetical protein [Dongia mobilis]|jgi:hypothetical protein|uniref:hypothetical protein n=1 Tax=Dongia sp. TaxID=1977262 RepID=UPI0026F12236